MERLIAEDLLLVCWDDDRGTVQRRCSSTLAAGVGGALLLDAVLAGAVEISDGRVHTAGTAPEDPLLAAVVAEAHGRRRPPAVKRVVQRLGTNRQVQAVRDRLVAAQVLSREPRRWLRLIPYTRYPLADQGAALSTRAAARALLTGQREAADADPREVLLAALTKPVNALDGLVARPERKAARARADAFGDGEGVPEAVGKVIREAQAATMVAVTAAAGSASSSSPR